MSMQDIKMAGALEFWLSKKIISASFTFRWDFSDRTGYKESCSATVGFMRATRKMQSQDRATASAGLASRQRQILDDLCKELSAPTFPMFSGIESWSKAPSTVSKRAVATRPAIAPSQTGTPMRR